MICMLLPYQVFSFQENVVKLFAFFGTHPWGIRSAGWKSISSDLKIETGRFPQRPGTTLKVGFCGGSTCSLGKVYSNTTFKHTPFHGITKMRVLYLSLLKWPWLCSWGVFNKNIGSIWIFFIDKKHAATKNTRTPSGKILVTVQVCWPKIFMNLNDSAMSWRSHSGLYFVLDLFVCVYIYICGHGCQ